MFVLVLFSCEASNKDDALPDIEVKTLTVGAAGYSQFAYVKASGAWSVDVSEDGGGKASWVTVVPASGDGSKSISLDVAANDSDADRSAVITVTSKAGEASAKLTQKGKASVKPDPDPTPDPEPNGGNLSPETRWMELPAISSGTDAFTHPMTVGSTRTRNYSFIWDYDNLIAPWVAYPLCKWNMKGSSGRTDAWALDPLLPADKQPVLTGAYREGNSGWYSRGHQIASADRQTSYSANSMTFYGTNMTPQINNGFNGDIWATLEGKVRSWANSSDTLYVVTGCVIDYKDGETVKYALDNNGKKVTVPTAYYKVVLRYMKSSTFGYSGYSACAVWLDHKVYSSKAIDSSYSMSVDDLEKKLDIDFFVNLPAKIGEDVAAKVEAENPADIDWWWR